MKVVVTGSSGYLGGKLCRRLLSDGHNVRALVRPSSNFSSLSPLQSDYSNTFDLAFGDVTNYSSLLDAFSGFEIVFHAAALVQPWIPQPSEFFSVNVEGLRNVLQACAEIKSIQKIIYTSSFFAIGATDGYVADETQIHQGDFFCTEYERSKTAADRIAMQSVLEGVPIVVVYPGVIYGPAAGKVSISNIVATLLIERFNGRLPGYIGNGSDKVSFSHIDDVVEGHISAMSRGRIGERYLLTGENASMNLVFDIAAIITQTKKPSFSIPLWVIQLYGWISIIYSKVTGKLPIISPPAVEVMRHEWAYTCEKAKVELGYSPRSLKEGLAEVLPWLKSLCLITY